jgi:yersiniabactin nonribosomal peptide synthetase
MIKVNGTRIDLGEIEAAASRIGLANPVAFARDNVIVLAAEGKARLLFEISTELAKFLPEMYLPKEIFFFDSLPRTLNGKLDRRGILSKIEARV